MKISSQILVSVFSAILFFLASSCELSPKGNLEKKKVKVPRPCINYVYLTDSTIVVKGRNLDPSLKEKDVTCEIELSNLNSRNSPSVFVIFDVAEFEDSICISSLDNIGIAVYYPYLIQMDSTKQILGRAEKNWKSISGMYFISDKQDRVKLLQTLPSMCKELFATIYIESANKNFYQPSADTIEYRSDDELFYGRIELGFKGDCRKERFPDDLYFYQ